MDNPITSTVRITGLPKQGFDKLIDRCGFKRFEHNSRVGWDYTVFRDDRSPVPMGIMRCTRGSTPLHIELNLTELQAVEPSWASYLSILCGHV